MNNYEYPLGADNSSAPWRQEENKPRKIKVTVSQTVSATFEIEVDDYITNTDWDDELGYFPSYDYSECDLKGAVCRQVFIPSVAANMLSKSVEWNEDEFEVILEE